MQATLLEVLANWGTAGGGLPSVGHQWCGRRAPRREGGARECSIESGWRTEVAGADRVSTTENTRAKRWWGVRMNEGEMGETSLCSILREDKAATTWVVAIGGVQSPSRHRTQCCAHAWVTCASLLSGRCG
jgi:hypothetical protein